MDDVEIKKVCKKVVVNEGQLTEAIEQLAQKVDDAFEGSGKPGVAVVLLEGARRFGDDLLEQVKHPFEVRYIRAKSYAGCRSMGEVEIEGYEDGMLAGKEVLLIDDIYDTGLTLQQVLEQIRGDAASKVRICVLLEKMREHDNEVSIDFVGIKVPDDFLIGYGLDYKGKYRVLPFIARFDPK